MNTLQQVLLPFTFLCVCTGCAVIPSAAPVSGTVPENPALGNRMISAMQAQDYACFVKDFSRELRESVTKAAFQKLCMDLADKRETIESWKLLDVLDRGGLYHTEVWKISFLRSRKQDKIRVERLFFVTKAKIDGRVGVIGFRGDPLF